jgi:hypothetical protein
MFVYLQELLRREKSRTRVSFGLADLRDPGSGVRIYQVGAIPGEKEVHAVYGCDGDVLRIDRCAAGQSTGFYEPLA